MDIHIKTIAVRVHNYIQKLDKNSNKVLLAKNLLNIMYKILKNKKLDYNIIEDTTMFITNDGFISLKNGILKKRGEDFEIWANKWKKSYEDWVNKDPIVRGPSYFYLSDKISNIIYESMNLYVEALKEKQVISPGFFIRNQNEIRKDFENFCFTYINNYGLTYTNNLISSDIYSKYINFMYINFPPGFGDMVNKNIQNNKSYNHVEIYYNCGGR